LDEEAAVESEAVLLLLASNDWLLSLEWVAARVLVLVWSMVRLLSSLLDVFRELSKLLLFDWLLSTSEVAVTPS
jgi:hypothetical protein